MRRLRWLVVAVAVVLVWGTGFRVAACNVPFFQVADEMLPFEHCVMYFYDGKSTTKDAVTALIKGEAQKWGDRVNVVFTSVDASKDYQKFILKHYKVEKAPVTLIVSPEDTVITRIPGLAAGDKLKQAFTSPAKKKIARELQKNKVVFLLFCNKKTKHTKEMGKVVKQAQKLLKEFDWCSAGAVEVDPKDKKEKFLLKNLAVSSELDEATLLVVFGSGFVVRDKLKWKLVSEDLLGIVQVLAGPCMCTFSPEMIVGNTLLFEQEKKPKKDEKKKG